MYVQTEEGKPIKHNISPFKSPEIAIALSAKQNLNASTINSFNSNCACYFVIDHSRKLPALLSKCQERMFKEREQWMVIYHTVTNKLWTIKLWSEVLSRYYSNESVLHFSFYTLSHHTGVGILCCLNIFHALSESGSCIWTKLTS